MGLPTDPRRGFADFHLGAAVYSADGTHVGTLHRLVVEREGWDPHSVIVQETARFSGHVLAVATGMRMLITDELVVPVSAIAHVSHDRVDLSITSSQVRRLPPYLTYHYPPVTDPKKAALAVVAGALGGTIFLPSQIEEADKSLNDIEIRPGEAVMLGHEGHKLGRVRDVLFDDGEVIGIVVDPEGFFDDDVVIQVRFLERSDDAALVVHMSQEELRHLKPFHPRA